ncbi:protein-disulfide reductase DsbD family protein [Luteolibacter arcticus]|uniref:Protein-disulfide reductase DsbD family protein n=1 Tax=Luteolibacter arcticus TaxID=1581411 RepID=A0ABT3GKF3_9BACT|nr:protein-disulfide reductase DsbD domain-containing protein [Luteolibacter arcticus]MCW1923999.1 protein-disulfide reductase DsbD family protein [Luteolibacter arcticus]
MKLSALLAAGLPFGMTTFAAEKSGHAEAELIAGVTSYQPGKPVPVGIKLKIEPGWHSYWVNPGVGGMPLSAKWTLPAGWTAGELQAPVPKRFMTGDLPGFGYEGEAVYRVDLTPPAGATGEAELKVALSWLTCNESACVPGDAEVSVNLPAGDGAASKDAAVLAAAEKKIPAPVKDLVMSVTEESDKMVVITLQAHLSIIGKFDPVGSSLFPATPEVIEAGEKPVFVKTGADNWTAKAKKNEYAEGPATLLDIVLTGGKLERPLIVSWRKEK